MITPRRTRLVRVADLHAFRRAITTLSRGGGPQDGVGDDTRNDTGPVVLVPTGGAGRQLQRRFTGGTAPPILTRDEFYGFLHTRLPDRPPRLSAYDRDVMMQSSARATSTTLGLTGRWRLRPGLLGEILRFYDQLRRQARNVARFEELVEETLSRDAEHDRGAERMLTETRVLTAIFRGYEARVQASGACDEHALRERLVVQGVSPAVRGVVVTVADWIADPNGLYLADFDLLTRLPGLETLDLVATDALLASGFHQRIHDWLPGIEEVDLAALGLGPSPVVRPLLGTPGTDPDQFVFVQRDREEELIAVARRMRARRGLDTLDRVAVVYKRPLPYLYLAPDVFGGSGIPYQASDALPLAGEPFAAALDLVLDFVESGFTRASLVALLRSPHFAFGPAASPVGREGVSALDRRLSELRYLGGFDRLAALEGVLADAGPGVHDAWRAAHAAAEQLAPLLVPAPASHQYRRLLDFLDAWAAPIAEGAEPRSVRARAAVRGTLESLMTAHAAHDEAAVVVTDIASRVRRSIEEHTWAPDTGEAGLHLLDEQAARYGDFDEMAIVGLIDGEWPDRPKRNIFYPASLLTTLGWPTEQDRRGAAEARFLELVASSSKLVTLSTISLDDEALVEPSLFVEEIPRARLSSIPVDDATGQLLEDALVHEDAPAGLGSPAMWEWRTLREGRTPADAAIFHGHTGPVGRRAWSVSALETYLGCPFRFLAQHVLRLQEEPDDEEVMDPRRQGQFIHEVFEAFFTAWQDSGHQSITPETIDEARALFRVVAERCLASLSTTEAALERTRLLGSPAAAGLAEAVFHMEAERPVPVVGRLLEHRLKGEFVVTAADGPRTVNLSGKADRIDLLADGTFRVIDYKLGWPPNKARALQLPIYGLCAEQQLDGYLGRRWTFGEAAYLAFKGPKRVVGSFSSEAEKEKVLAEAQARLVATIDRIESGEFPPTPDDVHRCETCAFDAVCRKDYIGDV